MPFNGSGLFVRVHNWVADKNAAIKINSTRMDEEDDGIATGLSTAICKDGQTTITANLPMATYKHTGVGAGTSRTDYADVGSVQDSTYIWCGTAGGTANAITLTPSPAITAYVAGQKFAFISGASANTAATTFAVSGLTTKAAQYLEAALVGGEIQPSTLHEIRYDGTAFQLLKAPRSRPINSQSTAYTTVMADRWKTILHPTADNNARTFTIDSNANVAYPLGTELVFVNQINTLTIAITSDTLTLEPDNTAGSVTVAAGSEAHALKISSTGWVIWKTSAGVTTLAALTDVAAQTVNQIPNADNAIDLGSSTKSWANIYCAAGLFIKNQQKQHAYWELANVAGTVKHRTGSDAAFASTGNFSAKWLNITTSQTTTPTGADGSTAMAGGGKISSADTSAFVMDTAAQVVADQNLTVGFGYNDNGADYWCQVRMTSLNVNGTTRIRPHIKVSNSTTGADINLTSALGSGKQFQICIDGFLA